MAFSLWGSNQFGGKVEYFYLERQQDMSIDDLVFFCSLERNLVAVAAMERLLLLVKKCIFYEPLSSGPVSANKHGNGKNEMCNIFGIFSCQNVDLFFPFFANLFNPSFVLSFFPFPFFSNLVLLPTSVLFPMEL